MSASILGTMLPGFVRFQESTTLAAAERLLAEEKDFVRAASRERVLEFATGRVCARAALANLGLGEQPILVHPDRSPVWPEGCVGSITHTTGYCAAAVARTDDCVALGIDAERIGRIEDDLLPLICTSTELAGLSDGADERHWQTTAIFCAKEAFYKAQFSLTRRWLDFTDVEIELAPDQREFSGRVLRGANGENLERLFGGAFGHADDLLIAAVCISARGGYVN